MMPGTYLINPVGRLCEAALRRLSRDFADSQSRPTTNPPLRDEDPNRRYSPPGCIGVRVEVHAGCPRPDRINTSYVERTNLTVRHFNKRFARLGLSWSRKLENHKAAISLFVAAFNFCKVHNTLGTTPAHGVGITSGPWTIEKLVEEANC